MSHSNGKIVPPIRTTLHDSDNKDSEEKEGRERGGREREKSTNSEISAFRIETHARQTRPRPFQLRSSLAPLGQSWSCVFSCSRFLRRVDHTFN